MLVNLELNVMRTLTRIDALGTHYYRWNVPPADGYLGGEQGTLATAPLIHTYSPQFESVSPLLALKREDSPIQKKKDSYSTQIFLTVQPLSASFFQDEGGSFRPTVKPHYAIATKNGRGNIYNHPCKTLMVDVTGNVVIDPFIPLQVHVHDGLLSPDVSIALLKEKLKSAFKEKISQYYISYVVDEKNKQILVTQHCLLNEVDHAALRGVLEAMTSPNLDDLVQSRTPIQEALRRFHDPITKQDPAIKAVFAHSVVFLGRLSPTPLSGTIPSIPLTPSAPISVVVPSSPPVSPSASLSTDSKTGPSSVINSDSHRCSDKDNPAVAAQIVPNRTPQDSTPQDSTPQDSTPQKGVVIRPFVVLSFKKAIEQLEQLEDVLHKKYGHNERKKSIIEHTRTLIDKLAQALRQYELPDLQTAGDMALLMRDSQKAVDDVKNEFNTHRDGQIGQFFGRVIEACRRFFERLFSSTEHLQIIMTRQNKESTFFGTKERLTQSAQALYRFQIEMEAAFETIDTDSHLGVRQHGA
jgi:hypothetical protein